MTYQSFLMFLFLLAASLPLESIAFVTTSSHRRVPALAAARITKPLQMSDAASEWYTPPTPAPLQAKLPKHAVPVVTHIDSPEAFQEYLQAPDDRITVVSFHAMWCKSCQQFGAIRFASVEWGANTELCRSLEITRLPSVHYYHNGRKLAGFSAGPSKFQLVKDRLTYYQSLAEEELEFEANIEQGGAAEPWWEQLYSSILHHVK
jgi:hypothetical protein